MLQTESTTQLSNFKLNTRKRGSIHNEHSTDEGLSPEASEHLLDFGTFSNYFPLSNKCHAAYEVLDFFQDIILCQLIRSTLTDVLSSYVFKI